MISLSRALLFSAMLLVMAGCRKGGCNVVDEITFQQSLFLGEYPELRVQGVPAVTETGGIAGLIVINTGNGYVAFDRCSTVNPSRRCAVEVDETNMLATDPCSGAKWILINGSPAEIAECPLKPYRVRRQGDIIFVSN